MDFFKTLDSTFRKWALEIAKILDSNFQNMITPRYLAYFAVLDFMVMILAFTQYRIIPYLLLWMIFGGLQYVERALAQVQKIKDYSPLIKREYLLYIFGLSAFWTVIILIR